jgi:hypothetical protein
MKISKTYNSEITIFKGHNTVLNTGFKLINSNNAVPSHAIIYKEIANIADCACLNNKSDINDPKYQKETTLLMLFFPKNDKLPILT